MNKRIKKKKAKQRQRYIEALKRVFMPLWSHYKLLDTPLLRMQELTDEKGYTISYESR